ncbi:hypothetical protein D9611_001256 [Ephemerocybe angulata]|uniref:F-box domain-containing protein n=1 Tax=Ephemerocybe angulata TaxID=980116 RepID=A0A8H5CHW1_9AGAR|nr:hypothetical protein D9611_001256 [Tulosesus angulatus]
MDGKDSSSPALTPFYLSNSLQEAGVSSSNQDYFAAWPCNHSISELDHKETLGTPIDNIPNEVLSHIVETAYFSEELPYDNFRSVMLKTSSRLRHITLSTPSLWSKYHLTQGNICDYLPSLPRYLQRSRDYPLDIHLSCFWSLPTTEHVMDLLLPHSRRWQHLSIATPNGAIFNFLENVSAPLLKTVSLSHFSSERRLSLESTIFGGNLPKLSQLLLRNISLNRVSLPLRNLTKLEVRGYGAWPDFAGLHEMLSNSETLEELVLHVKPAFVLEDLHCSGNNQAPITLPALRTFTVLTSEWLTDDVARLVRTFSTPNLESLVIQEGCGPGHTSLYEILRYSASPSPLVRARHADVGAAFRCLEPEKLEKLHTLELTRAAWKDLANLSQSFQRMLSLEKLVLLELNPFTALQDLGIAAGDTPTPISIPSLRTLDIDVIRDFRPADAGLAQFIRLFSLPSLSSLILRHLSQHGFENTVDAFAGHVDEYPELKALTVTGTPGLEQSAQARTLPLAFPHLKTLSMLHVPSNLFLSCLARSDMGDGAAGVPWPDLESLMVSGDPNASKPLLHKVILEREAAGRPLKKLFLDGSFQANAESWEWIRERVDVVEVPSVNRV